jgi:ring-1,2-phenylacetyl-CoA epoxidase subunit PaaC
MAAQTDFFTGLVELADDSLILGHRLSEWSSFAPMLEEDLALSNLALDLIGAAASLYSRAAEVEGKGRTEDDLAYTRIEPEYLNCLLVERPNEDFAHTILRQFYFAAFMEPYWQAAAASSDEGLRGIAAKCAKEMAYHLRHSAEWVIRLGDGTDESAQRMRDAVEDLHIYTDELFRLSPAASACAEDGLLPDRAALRAAWDATVARIFAEATLDVPGKAVPRVGGREGRHTEALGHVLSDLQYMQRTYPGLTW